MNFNQYDNLVEATADLTKREYKHSFQLTPEGMQCLESNKYYQPDDMKIIESHRFEGYSNPSDTSIIFAVKCKDGKMGMIISSYGTYADETISKFMVKVERVPDNGSFYYQDFTQRRKK
jgi:hypothetical protein